MNLDFGRSTLGTGHLTLDIGHWTFHALVVALGFLGSCQSNPADQPTLSDEKITQIMADLCVADGATNGLAGYTKDSLVHIYIKQVFELHGVTLESYEKDLRILAKDLPRMEVVVKKADELLTETGEGKGNTLKK